MVSGWRVDVRDPDLYPIGICDVFTSLKLVLRHRRAGAWSLTLPADHPQAVLFTEGAGILVWAPWSTERPVLSGPVTRFEQVTRNGDKDSELVVEGVDDTALLADRLVLPNPASAMSAQDVDAYWTTTGAAEKVIRDLVDYNCGDAGLAYRRLCDADPDGRRAAGLLAGSQRSVSARFDNLLTLVGEVASTDNLALEVVQPGGDTQDRHLRVWQPVDRSGQVRLSQSAGTLVSATANIAAPTATNVLVAGGGEGTARVLVERSADDLSASWRRRIETFRDARDTSDTAVLAERGDETLADAAVTAGINLVPVDTAAQSYGHDYGLGDLVSVDMPGGSYTDVISGVDISLTAADAVVITPQIGDPDLADIKNPAIYRRIKDLVRRLEQLERRQ